MGKQSRAHSLRRLSPKGVTPAMAVCVLCGREMLMRDLWKTECENLRGLTPDQAVMDALKGGS